MGVNMDVKLFQKQNRPRSAQRPEGETIYFVVIIAPNHALQPFCAADNAVIVTSGCCAEYRLVSDPQYLSLHFATAAPSLAVLRYRGIVRYLPPRDLDRNSARVQFRREKSRELVHLHDLDVAPDGRNVVLLVVEVDDGALNRYLRLLSHFR